MPVGGAERFDIILPAATGVRQVATTPGEAWPSQKMHQYDVGQQAGMAAIAVRKRMNHSQAMMKTHGDLVRRVRGML